MVTLHAKCCRLCVLLAGLLFLCPVHLVEAALPDEEAALDACSSSPRHFQEDREFQFGSLHDVVGKDGVLVISLKRKKKRFDETAANLKQAAIWPSELAAADAKCLSEEELSQGCLPGDTASSTQTCAAQGRTGTGCKTVPEQAIAESHRRALVAALNRSKVWTAILEDDVVAVRPERWNEAFKKSWQKVPDHVKLVRLSWCHFPNDVSWATLTQDSFRDAGDFRFVSWTGYAWQGDQPGRHYNPGLCTSAYMVHRDVIPEMLKLFPCCTAVDTCYLLDFFVKGWEGGTPRGLEVMMSLDAWGSADFAEGFQVPGLHQSGVLVQDTRELPSERSSAN